MLFITLAVFALSLPMKETYKPEILRRRAKRLGVKNSPAPAAIGAVSAGNAIIQNFVRPVHMLVSEVSP